MKVQDLSQQDEQANGVSPGQTQPKTTATGFFSGSWGYRDLAMFTTQGLTALGGVANYMLGGWNISSSTSPAANASHNQPATVTTANSYILPICGVLFTVATIVQVVSHYGWRQDQNAATQSLSGNLEQNLQEIRVIVDKVESLSQVANQLKLPNQIKLPNQELHENI